MRKAVLILFVALLAAPAAFAAKRVTVAQLSHLIESSSKKKDSKVASRLNNLQLTQRLSAKKLAAFEAALPGPESRRALVALADQALFLDPPPEEIPNQPAPSLAQQRAIIAKSVDYAAATLHRFPNLFARRDTIRYEDMPPGVHAAYVNALLPFKPLHPVSRSIATVLYRDGQEIVQKSADQQGGSPSASTGLTTHGEFGPIFSVVYGDLPKSNLKWSHWERGPEGLEAVFSFAVPKASSHYQVEFCCISGRIFQEFSAYHGELSVDPSTGTILRLVLIADLGKNDPIAKAQLMVQYGPVELGGKTYFCPVKSVSISVAPVQPPHQAGAPFTVNESPMYMRGAPVVVNSVGSRPDAPLQTMLNETVFDQYHLFRGDVEILTTNKSKAGGPTAPANASSESAAATSATPAEQATVTNQNPAPAAASTAGTAEGANPPVAGSAAPPPVTQQPSEPSAAPAASAAGEVAQAEAPKPAVAESTTPSATSQPAAPAAKSATPEMAVVAPGSFPQTPGAIPATANNPGFSLNLNARLVDVDVTAYDKKGRPVTNLTNKDFAIYDNGRKQSIRSFSHVGSGPAGAQAPAKVAPVVFYSNRPDAAGSMRPAGASAPGSSTVLLLDPTSLAFGDLNHARHEILRFLERLPKSEPVGLYVRTGSGFQILAEQTTDHAALSSTLSKWMPSAPALARSQEEEMRNRQQFDTVSNANDMQYVNGNMSMPGADGAGVDSVGSIGKVSPKLSKEGTDPTRNALGALVGVAAHMDAIPGHKNLIWVASDNVLANWSDQAPGADISSNSVGSLGLRAQEALNNAHVSLYALDASQLEAMGRGANLQNSSVQLDASQQTMNPGVGRGASMTAAGNKAEMLQDIRAVQPALQHLAQATGGRAFPRAGNMVGELNHVVAAGNAAYLLSFSPDTQPDGKYHQIKVTVPGRRGIKLRYRAGYLYTKEATTLKARFRQAVWQPQDATEIALSAHWTHASEGAAVSLRIAATDISMKKQGDRWTDRLNIFLVQRDDTGTRATVKEQTLALNLQQETYQKVLHDGIPFAEYVQHKQNFGTVRVIVVDENSGRMGSVTLPTASESASR